MVGIAQPESFSIFLRKIGYSVGLENTLERFSDFCNIYASVPQIKHQHWQNLVHEQWGLKTSNISDVFASLGIVEINTQGVYAGPFGEAGAICIKSLEDSKDQSEALKYLLGLAIVLADGDIFLNCLASNFKTDLVLDLIKKMVLSKRQQLFDIFHTQQEREAIATAIGIERQKTNKGGGSSKKRLDTNHLGSLSAGMKKFGLPQKMDVYHIEAPSNDYLRHVLTPREGWAKSLGLISKDGAISELGWTWLQKFSERGFILEGGEYSCSPTTFELEKANFSPLIKLIKFTPSTWDYIRTVFEALGGNYSSEDPEIYSDSLGLQTKQMFKFYKGFSQDRSMIRNELPVLIALSAYMAISAANKHPIVDYYSWIQKGDLSKFGIKIRPSRTIEMGLVVA